MLDRHLLRQAELQPERIAIEQGGAVLSYAALNTLADRFAAALQQLGCGPGERVALALPKQPLTYAAILGVLRAGCAYVPLDPAGPTMRNRRMIERSDPRCVVGLGGARVAELLRAGREEGRRTIWVAEEGAGTSSSDLTLPDVLRTGEPRPVSAPDARPAYILFTSGTTGEPKGVVVTHANVQAFLDWAIPWFGIAPGDRLSGHPPLQFDLSVFDLFGSLAAGATLCPVDPELNLLPHRIVEFMRERKLTQWFSVPTVFSLVARLDALEADSLPHLERVLWCGEVMPVPTLRYWMERLPSACFTNLYGPTEATIASSYYRVPAPPADDQASVPIGRACAGEKLLVLDESRQPCRTGEVGELYIGGTGLSPGYWGDEERTALAFPTVRLPAGTEERLYRTGDLASVGSDGEIRFHGRADRQIKMRGYRIELGEIEVALATLPDVAAVAVVAVEAAEVEGPAICCAYVPTRAGAELAARRAELANILPPYMIPVRWYEVTELPRNANGKVDHGAVRALFADHDTSTTPVAQTVRRG